MNRALRAVPLSLLGLAAACGESPAVCPDPGVALPVITPSLKVAVVDSVTGGSLVPGARGRWIVGAQTDSLYNWGSTLAGFGPAGRYSVAVEAPGYRAWARSDIRVRAGTCAPQTEEVTARLQRE
ncbi:MAG TPA: carboxypeptidase-like regulatory domain-containing protein [Longimicrobium sp.]